MTYELRDDTGKIVATSAVWEDIRSIALHRSRQDKAVTFTILEQKAKAWYCAPCHCSKVVTFDQALSDTIPTRTR